ncbi:E3 ubiquitin-protein ligase RNF146-A-like [Panonychus citri]|uniref:E3 ubiquitin-protein ligase RNF146-A-like n=1 Tax=Panonychus citri TaxID=50023 RepID=UPI00230829C9|nr:E3 ubiquitin-protein ligase RNF146-A-like [Panonychus citri]XP_053215021.1 E3 ubiquitin-protein ligase RNF146-A-like [Panonychus citri]
MTDPSNCPVCLGKPNIPIVLGCNHVFCYLCLKGSSTSHMNCPICRQPYPSSVFIAPDLKQKSIQLSAKSAKWSYQGRNGYWLFDRITNGYMENAYQNKRPICEVLIAGNTYVIDFTKMIQFRKDIPGKRRHIKRSIDLDRKEIKGIAGVSQRLLKVKLKRKRLANCDSGEGTSSISQQQQQQEQQSDNDNLLDDQDSQSNLPSGITIKREKVDDVDSLPLPMVDSVSLLNQIKEEIIDNCDEIVKVKEEPEW